MSRKAYNYTVPHLLKACPCVDKVIRDLKTCARGIIGMMSPKQLAGWDNAGGAMIYELMENQLAILTAQLWDADTDNLILVSGVE